MELDPEEWAEEYNYSFHGDRYELTVEIVTNLNPDGKILDVGAAPFELTRRIKEEGYDVEALDVNPCRAEEYIMEHELSVNKVDIERESFPFNDGSIDFVIFTEVFEHLYVNPLFTLREINRVLSDNGLLLLTTPNLYSIFHIGKFLLGRGLPDPVQELQKFEDIGHRGHIRLYSPMEMRDILSHVRFDIMSHEFDQFEPGKLDSCPILKYLAPIALYLVPRLSDTQVIIAKPKTQGTSISGDGDA